MKKLIMKVKHLMGHVVHYVVRLVRALMGRECCEK